MKKLLCALALVGAFTPASAARFGRHSQETEWEFGLHPGAAIAGGDYRHTSLSAFGLGASVGYNPATWFTVGVEGGFTFGHKLRGTTRTPISLDLDRDGIKDVLPFDSNVRNYISYGGPMFKIGPWLNFGDESKWKPYLIGGCGMYNERIRSGTLRITGGTTSNGTVITTPQNVFYDDRRGTYFGLDGGVGFEIKLEENGGIGAEARYRMFFRRGEDYEALTPSLRLLYYF